MRQLFFWTMRQEFLKTCVWFFITQCDIFLQQVAFIATMLLPNVSINANWDVD